ncbi:MAG: S-layer homology domain-containing protein [Clostridia bacterium]|nr:S-layer homology domain-containing protein [Clostridia bacterium]
MKLRNFTIIALIAASVFAMCLHTYADSTLYNPDTSTWYAYEPVDVSDTEGTVLDVSWILDAPAGKHGYLSTEGDNFVFEDGTEANFWGINIILDMSYTREHLSKLAEQCAQKGYNIVRLLSLDRIHGQGVIGRKSDLGRIADSEFMDKLCFFISELKARGIYCCIPLCCYYVPVLDDNADDMSNITHGLKSAGIYDDKLIKIQKDYAYNLLTTFNPYTGYYLYNDPVLAMIEIKNEDSLPDKRYIDGSDYYSAELKQMFNDRLLAKYQNREGLLEAWTMGRNKVALDEGEDPKEGTVAIISEENKSKYSTPRDIDTMMFLSETQKSYVDGMKSYLHSIGVKCPVSGATVVWDNRNSLENALIDMDYIDVHAYVNHPTGSKSVTAGTVSPNSETALVSTNGLGDLRYFFASKMYGRPTTLSEWDYVYPHAYAHEGQLLMASYASLQGFHPMAFQGSNEWLSGNNVMKTTLFDNMMNPAKLAAMPAAALIYHRRDAVEADNGFYPVRYEGREPYVEEKSYGLGSDVIGLNLIGKSGKIFDEYDGNCNDIDILKLNKQGLETGIYVSSTGDMSLDTNEQIFRLNTERSQAITGFVGGKSIELDDVIYSIDNDFATVYTTSLTDDAIYNSEHILITLVGRTANTGQTMSEDNTTFVNPGTAPILIEPVTGSFVVKTTDDIAVYALDSSGQRDHEISVSDSAGGKCFSISAEDKAMHIEIVRLTSSQTKNEHISLGNLSVEDSLFSDISSHKYKEETERAVLLGYMDGETDTQFMPDTYITRRDFIRGLVKALGLKSWIDTDLALYADVPADDPDYESIYTFRMLQIIPDGKGYLYPDAVLTRDTMESWLEGALGWSFKDKSADEVLSNLPEDNVIGKSQNITRLETALILDSAVWK